MCLPDPCEDVKCKFYAECKPLPDNTHACQCVKNCPKDKVEPVCGNDGNTYPTECALRLRSCEEKKPITVQHKGVCSK